MDLRETDSAHPPRFDYSSIAFNKLIRLFHHFTLTALTVGPKKNVHVFVVRSLFGIISSIAVDETHT